LVAVRRCKATVSERAQTQRKYWPIIGCRRCSGNLHFGGGWCSLIAALATTLTVSRYRVCTYRFIGSLPNRQAGFPHQVENLLDKRYVSSSIYDDTVIQGNRLLFQFLAGVQLIE